MYLIFTIVILIFAYNCTACFINEILISLWVVKLKWQDRNLNVEYRKG